MIVTVWAILVTNGRGKLMVRAALLSARPVLKLLGILAEALPTLFACKCLHARHCLSCLIRGHGAYHVETLEQRVILGLMVTLGAIEPLPT